LPDRIVFYNNLNQPFYIDKTEAPLDAESNVTEPYFVYYGIVGEGIGIEVGSGRWSVQQDFGFLDIDAACLFFQLLPGEGESFVSDWYYDDFADTYMVDVFGEEFEITRRELCRWDNEEGTIMGNQIFFGELIYNDDVELENYGWFFSASFATVDGQGDAQMAGGKVEFQNSPVGSYFDPLANTTATISEP
jgi:hypothetical protein